MRVCAWADTTRAMLVTIASTTFRAERRFNRVMPAIPASRGPDRNLGIVREKAAGAGQEEPDVLSAGQRYRENQHLV
jgi:hypothetical protein